MRMGKGTFGTLAALLTLGWGAPLTAHQTAPVAGNAITIPGPQGPLAGTLVNAGPGAPVAVILPGSGPTDRDGNNPAGLAAAPYRLLAQALAVRGISTVRIDKRGMFASNAAVADPNAVSIADYAADARAWASAARAATGAPCAWLIGHSEGGLVALAAADAPGLCGIITVAAAGRPFGILIREQLRANPGNAPLLAEADAALSTLEAGGRVDAMTVSPPLLGLFNPDVQGYLADLLRQDPARLAAAVKVPMLIVQGTNDIQILEADARALAAAQPKAKLVMLPGVNHVLKQIGTADRTGNLMSYADPTLPIDPGVPASIADFILAPR